MIATAAPRRRRGRAAHSESAQSITSSTDLAPSTAALELGLPLGCAAEGPAGLCFGSPAWESGKNGCPFKSNSRLRGTWMVLTCLLLEYMLTKHMSPLCSTSLPMVQDPSIKTLHLAALLPAPLPLGPLRRASAGGLGAAAAEAAGGTAPAGPAPAAAAGACGSAPSSERSAMRMSAPFSCRSSSRPTVNRRPSSSVISNRSWP
mmetsp:Transcript_60933/g.173304  ORF Transcript_60933/g.173304 Transcript_60933/m.173304 type:complete len:204 (-) Transcript_60933:711-1322(-)